MFEHFNFRVPRYGEDAVRKNPLNRKVKFICSPEFEELFNSLFPGVDFAKVVEFGENAEVAKNETPGSDYEWSCDTECDEDDDDEPDGESEFPDETYTIVRTNLSNKVPKFHQDWLKRQVKTQPKNESSKVPPSIFDSQETLDRLFGIKKSISEDPPKDAFVFMANRLTFLIKTRYPIIWDTSTVETIGNDIAFIALDEENNPQIDLKNATEIAMAINKDEVIQNEIEDYFKDTKWQSIYCAPFNMDVKGKRRLGFVFYVRLREDD